MIAVLFGITILITVGAILTFQDLSEIKSQLREIREVLEK